MFEKKIKVLSFGELLWDQFGDKQEIGGAPFNFSAHLVRLGAQVELISAVGNDLLGNTTLEMICKFNIETNYVSVSSYPTGVCQVTTNHLGFPSYGLKEEVTYDNIILTDEQIKHIVNDYNVFYYGTLAQRSDISRNTLNTILSSCKFNEIFCDLNIRQKYYNIEMIENCLTHCTILKVSREEYLILEELDIVQIKRIDYKNEYDFSLALCKTLNEKYHIKIIIITMDKDGAMLYQSDNNEIVISEKPRNKVVSTVGAGDSFSACFLYNYLQKVNLNECINRAVELSDFVVTALGAVPEYPSDLLERISKF